MIEKNTTRPPAALLWDIVEPFRSKLANGETADIAEILKDIEGKLRSDVFKLLVTTEIKIRKDIGNSVNRDDYERRFPEYASLIKSIFEPDTQTDSDTSVNNSQVAEGQLFGEDSRSEDYANLEEIGRGKMGVVYRAWDTRLNRFVALKRIIAGAYASKADLTRFETEVKVLARLKHPNIVSILGIGKHEGFPFAALELVEDGSLDANLAGTPLSSDQAARLIKVLADAVHAAHAGDIVHRDLKPANILLQRSETAQAISLGGEKSNVRYIPKITDFGLAKLTDADSGHTKTGVVLGTPSYMAPEQATGNTKSIGPAADIYALGAIMYECLTGRPPFRAESPQATQIQVINVEPPSPRTLQPGVSHDMETICLKCLEKNPKRRYASAQELGDDLQRFLTNTPIKARPAQWYERAIKWMKRHPVLALLCLSTLLISTVLGVSVYVLIGKNSEIGSAKRKLDHEAAQTKQLNRKLEKTLIEVHEKEKSEREARQKAEASLYLHLITRANQERAAKNFTEANRLLAECPISQRKWEWYCVKRLCPPQATTLVGHTLPVKSVTYSPDGRILATGGEDGTVRVWDAKSGKAIRKLGENLGVVMRVFIQSDSTTLVGISPRKMRIWNADTGESIRTLTFQESIRHIAFSRNASKLAVVVGGYDKLTKMEWQELQIREGMTGKIEARLAKHTGSPLSELAFSPDGSILICAAGRRIQVWDTELRQQTRVFEEHTVPVSALAFSANGEHVASAAGEFGLPASTKNELRVWNARTGKQVWRSSKIAHGIHDLSYRPDGKYIVSVGGRLQGTGIISIWDSSNGTLCTTYGEPQCCLASSFNPKGTHLAVTGLFPECKIHKIEATPAIPLTIQAYRNRSSSVAFSPDGKLILSSGETSHGRYKLKLWDASDGSFVRNFEGNVVPVCNVEFDPNGAYVACGDLEQGVNIWDASTGKTKRTLVGHQGKVNSVSFSPNGKYLASAGVDTTIRIWDVPSGIPIRVLTGHTQGVFRITYSPDGSLLASSGGDRTVRIWEASTGKILRTLSDFGARVLSVRFSPNGTQLATIESNLKKGLITTGPSSAVKVWNVQEGKVIRDFKGHAGTVWDVSFNSDGTRLFTCGGSPLKTELKVWDVASGQELITLGNTAGLIFALHLDRNNRRLATAGVVFRLSELLSDTGVPLDLGTIQIWDVGSR